MVVTPMPEITALEETADEDLTSIRRQLRLVTLLDAADRAGIAPLALHDLHLLAYFSNVMAPVWDIEAFEGAILKARSGPFYPSLQLDIDLLIGRGLVVVHRLRHLLMDDGGWRLDAAFELDRARARAVLQDLDRIGARIVSSIFLRELTYAFGSLNSGQLERLTQTDVTYADPLIAFGNVLDFGDIRAVNRTAIAASGFRQFISNASSAELIHLYLRHLSRSDASGE